MSKSIGERRCRFEDDRLVRGEGKFVADENPPNATYAAIFRSPAACANIRNIDITSALETEGVLAVLTGADVENDRLGGIPWEVCPPGVEKKSRFQGDPEVAMPQPLLANSQVRYVGEPIALVVGETQASALSGAEAISVDFEFGEPLIGIEAVDALQERADALFAAETGNPAGLEECFTKAFGVVHLRTHVPRLAAAPIEPRGYVSQYHQADDRWTIWAAAGKPHPLRDTIASHVFHVDPQKIHLIANDIGGGFGGKNVAHAEAALTLWAAKRIGRPVRWISTRLEAFQSDMQGRDHLIEARLAYTKDGIFTAVDYDALVDLGAYLSPRGVMPALTSLKTITGPYLIEHAHGRVRGFLTNTVPTCTYRGAGAPESAYAIERLVDMAAAKLSIDPVEIRRRNIIKTESLPWKAPTGVTFHSVDFPAILEAASRSVSMVKPRKKGDRFCYGSGLAFTIECYSASFGESAEIVVKGAGPIEIRIGTKSAGQSHETTYAQIASDLFGLPNESFKIIQGDTTLVGRGNGTGASRSLTVGGSAIIGASTELIETSRLLAAEMMQCSPESLVYAAGRFSQKGEFGSSIDLFTLSDGQPGGSIRASGDFKPSQFTIPGGCHVAKVEVDLETGRVRLLEYRLFQDAGVAVNPMIVEGQLHGGIVQGIGAALGEVVRFDLESGQLITASFQDYAMPRAHDACGLEVSLLGVPCASNLIGAKPVGEAGTVGAPPAIVNAILNAIDCANVQHIELPATPECVWRALQHRKSKDS
jgi:aerobic carbon-monoxide dehydrogenase large subunit